MKFWCSVFSPLLQILRGNRLSVGDRDNRTKKGDARKTMLLSGKLNETWRGETSYCAATQMKEK